MLSPKVQRDSSWYLWVPGSLEWNGETFNGFLLVARFSWLPPVPPASPSAPMRIEIGSSHDLNSTLPCQPKTEARACGRGLQSGAALDSGERFSQVPLWQLDARDST